MLFNAIVEHPAKDPGYIVMITKHNLDYRL